jgi:copper chaperone
MIELTLPDISCGHCVKTVTQTIQALDPAAEVQIDLPTHRVSIQTTLPAPAVEAALAEQGYPAAH